MIWISASFGCPLLDNSFLFISNYFLFLSDVKYPKLKYKGKIEKTLLRNGDPNVSIAGNILILRLYPGCFVLL